VLSHKSFDKIVHNFILIIHIVFLDELIQYNFKGSTVMKFNFCHNGEYFNKAKI